MRELRLTGHRRHSTAIQLLNTPAFSQAVI